jgi:hypothetical protein
MFEVYELYELLPNAISPTFLVLGNMERMLFVVIIPAG